MKRKGFTLLELILVIALIGSVTAIAFNFLFFGMRAQRIVVDEFEIQSSVRLFAEHINNTTRFATSAHTVPKSSFQTHNHRDPNWSYIGINNEGHVVLDEPGETLESPRKVKIIAEKKDGIEYKVSFHPIHNPDGTPHQTLMKFVIEGYRNDTMVIRMDSDVEVMNSHQIEHKGSIGDPAVALSFTKIDRDSPEFINVSPDAHIAMVIDVSGSMDWAMGGQGQSGDKRIDILKVKAHDMIDKLSNMGFDIYVTIVPFSDNANNPSQIRNVNKNNPNNGLDYIKTYITNLNPVGATNTGDGLRRAYYQLEVMGNDYMARPENSGLDPTKKYTYFTQHMMILVDGATNRETYSRNSTSVPSGGLYTGPNNVTNHTSIGSINRRDPFVSTGFLWWITYHGSQNNDAYVDLIGNNLIKNLTFTNKFGDTEQVIKSFVIGFSARTQDHISLDNIGEATNAKEFEQSNGTMKRFIIATDADELDFAFGSFTEEVSASLWSIYGPSLQ